MARRQNRTTARKKQRPSAGNAVIVVDFDKPRTARATSVASTGVQGSNKLDESKDESLALSLQDIAQRAMRDALQNPRDWKRTALARAAQALWLAVAEDDERLVRKLELVAMKETPRVQGRRRKRTGQIEPWAISILPPRAGVDRGKVLVTLRDFVAHACTAGQEAGEFDADKIAWAMFQVVSRTFSQLDATNESEIRLRIKDRVTSRLLRVGKLEDEELVIDALEAFGVPRGDVHNWLKGAPPPSPKLIAINDAALRKSFRVKRDVT